MSKGNVTDLVAIPLTAIDFFNPATQRCGDANHPAS